MRTAPRRPFRLVTSLGLCAALVALAPGLDCYAAVGRSLAASGGGTSAPYGAVGGVARGRGVVPSLSFQPGFAPALKVGEPGFSLSRRLGPNVNLGTFRFTGAAGEIVPVIVPVAETSPLQVLEFGGAQLAASPNEGEKRGILDRLFTGIGAKPAAEAAADAVLPAFVSGLERMTLESLSEGALEKSLTLAERKKVVETIARKDTPEARAALAAIGAYDAEADATDYEVKRAALKLLAEQGVVLSLPPMSKAHAAQVLQKLSAERPEAAVFDYDDTLEPHGQSASPETAAALQAVADNGIETMVLTVRPGASILESLSTLTPAQKAKLTLGAQRGAQISVFGKDGKASLVQEQAGLTTDKSLGVRALRAESAFYARARDVLRFVPKALRGMALKLAARLPKRSIPAGSVVLVGDHFEGTGSIDGAMIAGAPGALALSVGGSADPRLENVFVWPEKGPAGSKQIMAALAKKGSGGVEARPLKGLFAARSVSIVAYILTMLAYPFLAIPVVGPAGFGALMGWGAMGAIATGPLNGLIVQRLSARNAMALTAVLRAVLALALPLFSFFGVLNFGTLLVAAIANGWALSSLMTTENIYIKRWAGPKLGEVNNGAFLNYLVIFGLMTLIFGVGRYIDGWNLSVPFLISAAAHLVIVLPILWKFIPNIAPPKTEVQPRRPGAAPRVRDWAVGAAGFLRRYWKEALIFAAGMGLYFWTGTTIAAALALVWWIRGTDGFKLLWADKRLRLGALFMAGAAFLFFPLQSLTLPLVAKALAGEAGRAALLGQLVGALFFGQLISSSGQARFGRLRLPFVGRFPAQRLIQAGVLAMAAAWVYMTLAPGSLLAAAAAVGLGAALMALSARLTQTGWIKLFGLGLAAVLVPLLAWGNIPLLFTSLLLLGLFYGPASVAFTNYFFGSMPKEQAGVISGVQSSLFNAAITLGYGVMSLLLSAFMPALPGAIAAIGVGFVALAVLAFLAPRFMPGLPGAVFKKKGER